MKLAVVIPTLNEEETIADLVRNLNEKAFVFVVDDNSSDRTRELAKSNGAYVIHNKVRQGIAKSLLTGMKRALESEVDYIATIDAGGSHQWDSIFSMLTLDADLVIGSRFLPFSEYDNTNGKFYRPFLSKLAAFLCRLAQARTTQTDWTSGFRVYTADLVNELLKVRFNSTMHPIQIELLGRANELGANIKEYPIKYVAGKSSFNLSVANEAVVMWLQLLNHFSARPKVFLREGLR